MPKTTLDDVLIYLRRVCATHETRGLSDAQLLQRFLTNRDESAFSLLVQRHGPMVLGVCQRVLRDVQAAEDGFQATFMVLIRRAAAVGKRQTLGGWLHGVAQRIALKARAQAATRKSRERQAMPMTSVEPLDELTWNELRSVLDEEIARLPEKYSLPIILCHLEGKTQDQAAKELGWPRTSLMRRIGKARELLRQKLVRRGITLSAAAFTAALGEKALAAPLAVTLSIRTVKAALSVAAGKTAVAGCLSAQAIALAEEAMTSMVGIKIKLLVIALTLALAAGGASVAGYRAVWQPAALAAPEQGSSRREAGQAEPAQTPLVKNQATKSDPRTDDSKRLQGDWQLFDFEMGGKAPRASGFSITFKGNEVTLNGQRAKFTLDPTKSLKEMDIIFFDGTTWQCIYSLENGELNLRPPDRDGKRQKEFKNWTGPGDAPSLILRRPENIPAKKIERPWIRPDAPPDGVYQLSSVSGSSEDFWCLIKLETKDGKQSANLIGTSPGFTEVKLAETVIAPTQAHNPGAKKPPETIHIKIVLSRPGEDSILELDFANGSLEARGSTEDFFTPTPRLLPAILRATEETKLKYAYRDVSPPLLQTAGQLAAAGRTLRTRADQAKDAAAQVALRKEAELADKEALTEVPKLYREFFEKYADHPAMFVATLLFVESATKYKITSEQLRDVLTLADKAAATYGRRWRVEFNTQIVEALVPQKAYSSLALDVATQLEKQLLSSDPTHSRVRALKALAAAQGNAGKVAEMEETLDREYRAKLPPINATPFAGRKAASDRAVVLELFTGTQCGPCVAADLALHSSKPCNKTVVGLEGGGVALVKMSG